MGEGGGGVGREGSHHLPADRHDVRPERPLARTLPRVLLHLPVRGRRHHGRQTGEWGEGGGRVGREGGHPLPADRHDVRPERPLARTLPRVLLHLPVRGRRHHGRQLVYSVSVPVSIVVSFCVNFSRFSFFLFPFSLLKSRGPPKVSRSLD